MRKYAAAAAICLSTVSLAIAADMRTVRESTYIAPQSLEPALQALAKTRGLQIVYRAEVVGAATTHGAMGELTAEEALRQLLNGTGLTHRFLTEDTVTIVPAAAATSTVPTAGSSSSGSSRSSAWQLASVEHGSATKAGADSAVAPESEASQQSVVIDEILVRGRRQSLATMKGDALLSEIPQNIQILSSALLSDMGSTFLHDALRSVAGVMPGGAYNGYDYFRVRGFDSNVIYLDGLRLDNFIINNAELYGLERVEVIKGPASTLYGDLFSGMVNLVSKRPSPQPLLDMELTAGSFGFQQAAIDVGGAINEAQTVYGRTVALYRHDGSFVDFVDGLERYYIAPSLTWDISDAATLTLFANFQDDRNELAFSLPARGTVLPNSNGRIPADLYYGDAKNPSSVSHQEHSFGYQVKYQVNQNVTLRQNARATWRKEDWDRIIYPLEMSEDERTIYRYPYSSVVDWDVYTADTGVDLKLATGAVEHSLTAGIDYFRSEGGSIDSSIDFGPDSYYAMPFDLFSPNYDDFEIPPLVASQSTFLNETAGAYLSDRAKLTDRLTMTIGGRWQWARGGNNFVATRSSDSFVKNAGLSYEFSPGFTVYGGYSEAFLAQYYTRLAGNQAADPQRGKAFEAGIKMSLLDERVNATLAVFELKKTNVAAPDPEHPGYSILTGEQRSRGFEYDSQILLTQGLQLLASYSYIDAEVLVSDRILAGTPLLNVPEHSASAWIKYTLQAGTFAGLGFSVGGSTYSKQSGDERGTFELPAYTLLNANVSYSRGPLHAQLNLYNLLDEEYFQGSSYDLAVLPGIPRSARLSLGWSF